MKYELVECERYVKASQIKSLIDEFTANGEFCNALWRAYDIGVDEWYKERKNEADHHETVLGFLVESCLIGVARITPHPNHDANGKIGYYIRPSYRRLGYGTILLHLLEDFCLTNKIYKPTAVCSETNLNSIRTLRNAGWLETGNVHNWKSEKGIRKALEFRPRRLCDVSEKRRD